MVKERVLRHDIKIRIYKRIIITIIINPLKNGRLDFINIKIFFSEKDPNRECKNGPQAAGRYLKIYLIKT